MFGHVFVDRLRRRDAAKDFRTSHKPSPIILDRLRCPVQYVRHVFVSPFSLNLHGELITFKQF